jgi:signal transduction histidine kinase
LQPSVDVLRWAGWDLVPLSIFLAEVPDGTILGCNQRARIACGGRIAAGARLHDLVHVAGFDGTELAPAADPIALALAGRRALEPMTAVLGSGPRGRHVVVSMQPAVDASVRRILVVACQDEPAAAAARSAAAALALSAADLGVWQLDLSSRYLSCSPQCKAHHGLGPETDLQLPQIMESIRSDERARFASTLRVAIQSRGSFEIEVPLRWPDGSEHWLRGRGRVVDESRMVGVSQDVTAERRAAEALREADRRKDEFLAVVSHELRGPLGAILFAANVLESKMPAEPVLQEARAIIERQTRQLSKLVEDLLDVRRIAAGKIELQRHRVELNVVLRRAVETSRPLINRRRHTLDLRFTPAPVYVRADAERLVQVVCNLLANAAKYMRDGGRITLRAASDGRSATIVVRDEGVGIPTALLEHVFEPYVQVRSSAHRASGGLGIGLSIAKGLIEMHGGTITAHSPGLGKGTEFVIRLPVVPISRTRAQPRHHGDRVKH